MLTQSPVPAAYQNQMSTCTLPRHPAQVTAHHWSSYGGTIAGVRQIPHVQISGLQTPLPPSQIVMHHLNTRATRHCIGGNTASGVSSVGGITGISTGVSLVDDEVTVETPLMVKRESTV